MVETVFIIDSKNRLLILISFTASVLVYILLNNVTKLPNNSKYTTGMYNIQENINFMLIMQTFLKVCKNFNWYVKNIREELDRTQLQQEDKRNMGKLLCKNEL